MQRLVCRDVGYAEREMRKGKGLTEKVAVAQQPVARAAGAEMVVWRRAGGSV